MPPSQGMPAPIQGLMSAMPGAGPADPTSAKPSAKLSPGDPGIPANYMGPDQGPFLCQHCEYYSDPGRCNNPSVVQELGPSQDDPSTADVDAQGCCNLYAPQS